MKRKVLIALCTLTTLVRCGIFDTYISYRYGTSTLNLDTARFPYEIEQPEAPISVDNTYVYTQTNRENDRMIDLVHCYAMRNGLYGDPKEVHILWTRLDLSTEDELRQGMAKDLYQLVVPAEERFS